MNILNRFIEKVEKTPTCWIWKGSKFTSGYGDLSFFPSERRAHRASWVIHYGKIPKGLHVLHKCDVKDCVNPEHLFLGTHRENMQDMVRKGRRPKIFGTRHGMSKLTEKDILNIRALDKKSISRLEISKQFNITKENVGYIVRRVTWTHI